MFARSMIGRILLGTNGFEDWHSHERSCGRRATPEARSMFARSMVGRNLLATKRFEEWLIHMFHEIHGSLCG
jgi:hypothetical protein